VQLLLQEHQLASAARFFGIEQQLLRPQPIKLRLQVNDLCGDAGALTVDLCQLRLQARNLGAHDHRIRFTGRALRERRASKRG